MADKLTGCAPCAKCNLFGTGIRLTGHSEPATDGGLNWELEPGQFCINCGEPWLWLHEPAKHDLAFPLVEISTRQRS